MVYLTVYINSPETNLTQKTKY